MFPALIVRSLHPVEVSDLQPYAGSENKEESCRAQVILLSSQGKTANEIGRTLGSHPANVKKWIRNFNRAGIEGIRVKKRGPQGGPRPKFGNAEVRAIVDLAALDPVSLGYQFSSWTPQKLANAAVERGVVERISHVTVRQILRRHSTNNGASNGASYGSDASPSSRNGAREQTRDFDPTADRLEAGQHALSQSRYSEAVQCFSARLGEKLSPDEEAVTRSLLSKALE